MKSIANQYRDLKEGKMTQHNFMRSLRMSMPQYITNVTSFKDSVRILKNKGILSEAMDSNPIEATLKSYLSKGYSYTEAIEATAAEQGMDEEVLMSQYPQDAVDTEGYEDGENDEVIDMIAKAEEEESGKYTKFQDVPGGISEAYADDAPSYDYNGKKLYVDNQSGEPDAPGGKVSLYDEEENEYTGIISSIDGEGFISVDPESIQPAGGENEDAELEDMIAKAEDGLSPEMYKNQDFPGGISEGKGKELHPNQIHPQELRMGIKVELEHTDSLDKAKKIALDHLAENPFYYTALKLAGVESPSAPKVKAPKAAKKGKAVEAELVDKVNAMKPVKGFEKAKASSNKAKKETNKIVKGVSELTHNAQSVRGLQKFAATGGKMKTVKSMYEAKLNIGSDEPNEVVKQAMRYVDGPNANPTLKALSNKIEFQQSRFSPDEAVLRYDYWDILPKEAIEKLELQFNVTHDTDQMDDQLPIHYYRLTPKKEKAEKYRAFQSKLETLVREVMNEMYDGRDDMNAQYAEDEITENDGSQEIEKKINTGEIDPAKVKAAAEKAMKGDSTDLALLMAFGK